MTTIHAHHDDAHGHGHGHPKNLAHHFDTPAQQFESGKLGMWLFLATEVLFFGGLFVAYAVLRSLYPEIFSFSANYLDTIMGGINTCVLIVSSLTMALAVRFAQISRKGPMLLCLWLTMGGAVGFLVIKYFEYTHKIHEHMVWGEGYYRPVEHGGHGHTGVVAAPEIEAVAPPVATPMTPDQVAAAMAEAYPQPLVERPKTDAPGVAPAAEGPTGLGDPNAAADSHGHAPALGGEVHLPHHLENPDRPANAHLFFAIYYCMTGLHGIHVVVGMIVIGWLIVRGMRGDFDAEYYTPVDLVGLYWHIVDLIWIFLFPLFYLIH